MQRPDTVRFPSASTLAWAASCVGRGARVVGGRRLVGGITSSVHRLTVEDLAGLRHHLVLRRWTERSSGGAGRVRHEAAVLEGLERSELPAPRLVGADPDGEHNDGWSSLLMTKVPGHVHLTPRDPGAWLGQMAALAPRIHAAQVDAPAHQFRTPPDERSVPEWSRHPHAWQAAIDAAREVADSPAEESCFIHRDFQHFNMLWSRERLTGIVDWVFASTGSPDVDIGHCRLNLAVLFGPDWAERFRLAYEAEAGRSVDARWDVAALLAYGPAWAGFIPVQAGRRATVDVAGMNERVDDLMAIAARRLQ